VPRPNTRVHADGESIEDAPAPRPPLPHRIRPVSPPKEEASAGDSIIAALDARAEEKRSNRKSGKKKTNDSRSTTFLFAMACAGVLFSLALLPYILKTSDPAYQDGYMAGTSYYNQTGLAFVLTDRARKNPHVMGSQAAARWTAGFGEGVQDAYRKRAEAQEATRTRP
jgi:hypothetical protein